MIWGNVVFGDGGDGGGGGGGGGGGERGFWGMQGFEISRSWHLVSIGTEEKAKRISWKVHALDLGEGRIFQSICTCVSKPCLKRQNGLPGNLQVWVCKAISLHAAEVIACMIRLA